jgi:glycosyltransferase involved in cell wall biosynthesis
MIAKTYLCWLPGKYFGGAEKYAINLSLSFAQRGIKVYIVCPYYECYLQLSEILSNDNAVKDLPIHICHCNAPSSSRLFKIPLIRSLYLLYWILQYKSLISFINPDSIHINLPFPSRSYAFILAATKTKVPVTITFHLVPQSLKLSNRYYRLYRRIIRVVTFTSVSHSNLTNLGNVLSIKRSLIKLIPNRPSPIGNRITQEQYNMLLGELNLNTNHFICTTVAALVPRKGYEDIINACRLVVERDQTYRFLFIGSGAHESSLRLLVESLDLAKYIHFVGQRSDVHELLQLSNVFVFASSSEGLSFALMEAVQHNIPLIASTRCGADEFLHPDIHYKSYENGNTAHLAHLLLDMKENYELALATANLAAKELEKYDYNSMFSDTSDVLFRTRHLSDEISP